jgi:hypothetical protein
MISHMAAFVALDGILGIFGTGMVDIAVDRKVLRQYGDYHTRHPACLRVPGDMITYGKAL